MPRVDLVVESQISTSARARQLEGMFDVPRRDVQRLEWHHEMPYDDEPWHVGLIVGPSGCGKSLLARELWGDLIDWSPSWGGKSVVDDFAADKSMADIAAICQAVGFNTIPAWLRPFAVLSNGEQFRVTLARRLLEQADPIVVDEFTSVVDRQVAQIGSHAVQKYIRRHDRKFVAITCHHDVIDWLQPDWVFSPGEGSFVRRSLQRRPSIEGEIRRVPYSTWRLFAPYHYLTAELHKAAQCFALFIRDQPVVFGATLYRTQSTRKRKTQDIWGLSRLVTLPDWQGLGLAFVLTDTLAAAYKATNRRFHVYPAHPALIRSFDKSTEWHLRRAPGKFGSNTGATSRCNNVVRQCAVFDFVGQPMGDATLARAMISHKP